MICPKCSANIADDAAFCPYCGSRVEVPAPAPVQPEPVAPVAQPATSNSACPSSPKSAAAGVLSSVLFLIYAIFVSTFTFATFISFLVSLVPNFLGAFFSIAPVLACAIVATVGVWLIFAGKNKMQAKNLNMIKSLMTVEYVFSIITMVLVCILCGLLLILALLMLVPEIGFDTGDAVYQINKFLAQSGIDFRITNSLFGSIYDGTIFLFIFAVLFVMGASITACIFSMRAYKQSGKYWKTLAITANGGAYMPEKVPTTLLYVWGCFVAVGGLFRLFFFDAFGCFANLALGGILFIQGMMFRKIHEAELKAYAEAQAAAQETPEQVPAEAEVQENA